MTGQLTGQIPLHVAIVGGGIAGVTLALGLLKRNINVKVYERGRSFHEIGAGIGFTSNAEWAMKVVDPRIYAAFKKVSVQNASDWFTWVDSYTCDNRTKSNGDTQSELIYKMYLGERGFEGCHRANFLDELVRFLPEGVVEFQKTLHTIFEGGDDEKLLLKFKDRTTAEADLGNEPHFHIVNFMKISRIDCLIPKLLVATEFDLEYAN